MMSWPNQKVPTQPIGNLPSFSNISPKYHLNLFNLTIFYNFINSIWKNSNKCFECGMKMYYKLMTYCCGICMALHWGCTFGAVAFEAIWIFTPMMRLLSILLHPIRKIMAIVLGTCCAPMIETAGLLFSRIHVVNSTGEPPKPLGHLEG